MNYLPHNSMIGDDSCFEKSSVQTLQGHHPLFPSVFTIEPGPTGHSEGSPVLTVLTGVRMVVRRSEKSTRGVLQNSLDMWYPMNIP